MRMKGKMFQGGCTCPLPGTRLRAALVLVVLWAVSWLLVPLFPNTEVVQAAEGTREAPPLELVIDQPGRARAFCRNVKVMDSIGGNFEFFHRDLTRGRQRIFSWYWKGDFRENAPGAFSLDGRDSSSGTEYAVRFKRVDDATVEFHLSFTTPSRTSSLEFEVVKLSSDVVKGGEFVVVPVARQDAPGIPTEPRSLSDRMLLNDKDRILIRGMLCDIEIVDLMGRRSMRMADGRNVSWDRFKSIIIGALATGLAPGSRQEFKYRIRALPPSRPIPSKDAAVSFVPEAIDPWSFFLIPPKEEITAPGAYRFREGDAVFGSPMGTAEAILSLEITKMTGLSLPVNDAKASASGRGISIERVQKADRNGIPAEGFEIAVTPDRVTVRGADERGCLYGAYALMGRIGRQDGAWGIGCGKVRDWPDLSLRGACLEMYPPAIQDVKVMKRYLDAYSRARSNVILFLHNPKHIRSCIMRKDDGRWTQEEMAEIVQHARRLHMDVWGGMGSKFRQADFPEMEIAEGSDFYNPFSEKNYAFLFKLYEELLKTYGFSTLMISHDEIQGLSVYADRSGKSTADILGLDVRRIHGWLAKRGIRTAMCGDMLLDHGVWEEKVGAAHSGKPFFRSGLTHLALPYLPRDLFILDWHYDERPSYPSIRHFYENGFDVAGTSWHDPRAAQALAKSVHRFGGQGIMATDFGFWQTMSPAATTLCAPLCGWSADWGMKGSEDDVLALAEAMRDPVYVAENSGQTPVDLQPWANASTFAMSGSAESGVFGAGPFLDLRALPPGPVALGGIRFHVTPHQDGQTRNAAVAANTAARADGPSKEILLFKGSESASRMAFLHTAFVKEPTRDVRHLGSYRVKYAGGSTETIDLLDNWNITDVRSSVGLRPNAWTYQRCPDVLIGSKRVWQGTSAGGMPLNLQLFVWHNPHPGKKIQEVRLRAGDTPQETRIVLLGLTFLQ